MWCYCTYLDPPVVFLRMLFICNSCWGYEHCSRLDYVWLLLVLCSLWPSYIWSVVTWVLWIRHAAWHIVGGNRVLSAQLSAIMLSELSCLLPTFNTFGPTSRILHVFGNEVVCVGFVSFKQRKFFDGLRKQQILYYSGLNPLAPELFFFNFSTPYIKMWIIQEPTKLALWNKLHFEEKKKTESIEHVWNIQYLHLLNKYIKCNVWRLAVWYDLYIGR